MDLAERAARIRLLVLDVDGVLTDGRLLYGENGEQMKSFHVRDGSGIKLWQSTGRGVAIISGRNAKSVTDRATELGITIVKQGQHPKNIAFHDVMVMTGLRTGEICVVGDDLMDLPMMLASGLSVAVADAVPEVRTAATYITQSQGGHGAVREAIEWLLSLTGEWQNLIRMYETAAT